MTEAEELEALKQGDDLCSDCFKPLDDSEYHCEHCGDHVDGLGDCDSGCEK